MLILMGKKIWVRKYLQFYAEKMCLSKLIIDPIDLDNLNLWFKYYVLLNCIDLENRYNNNRYTCFNIYHWKVVGLKLF